MELLFESRPEIGGVEGKLVWTQTRPTISDDPVIIPDGVADGAGASIYGSVIRDGGRYRMWYQGWPREWDGGDVSVVAYAESDDGDTWPNPSLGIVDFDGEDNTACNLGMHCPSVFIEPSAPSSHRYRATGYTRPGRVGTADVEHAGYFASHSSDGLRWQLDTSAPQWEGGDVITSIFHPAQDRAIVALKRRARGNAIPRRAILNAELVDGTWSEAEQALIPDEFDDVCALTRGFASGDYYGMGMMAAGSGTVGFIWQFRHSLPRTRGTEAGVFGIVDCSLAYQATPSGRWVHAYGREDFIGYRDMSWGTGGMYTASCPVDFGKTQRLYFCAARHTHGWYLDSEWKRQPKRQRELITEGLARIGYAEWPTDRLAGFRSDPEGILELKLEAPQTPVELRLNYAAEKRGSMRVELPDVPGHAVDGADVLAGDELDAPYRWPWRE